MLSIGSLTFAAPWLLIALAGLPIIWWLLRINPPTPRRITFPAVRLLLGLRQVEETPAHTPLWLLLLRLVLAALVILAAAQPFLAAGTSEDADGPLVMVIDDGWAAGGRWQERIALGEALIEAARLDGRGVLIAGTAPVSATGDMQSPRFMTGALASAADALATLRAMEPRPWPVDRAGFAAAFNAAAPSLNGAEVVWLSDGIADPTAGATEDFLAVLQALGRVTAHVDPPAERAVALLPPGADATGLTLQAVRADARNPASIPVRAIAQDGRVLARQNVEFAAGKASARQRLELPAELRNEIVRLTMEGKTYAAATVLMDGRYRRRPVGLISGGGFESSQPLLSDLYYLQRALSPFSQVRQDTLEALIQGGLSVLFLADVGRLTSDAAELVDRWIAAGGILVRFAGIKVADGIDSLVPVKLRAGGRALGGALTWEQPQHLSPFPQSSPFSGLAIPDDVVIERQVLAEPALDLDDKTWARLGDGTPLVTAENRGQGWLVLFHTTANTEWSSLALSGLFVEMMKRIVALSEGVAGFDPSLTLPNISALDGFGRLGEAAPDAVPISGSDFATARPGPGRPPGEYGDQLQRRALNLGGEDLVVRAFEELPGGVRQRSYAADTAHDLQPWFLLAALALALADTVISLWLRGMAPAFLRRSTGVSALLILTGLPVSNPTAQEPDGADFAEMAQETRFAYVKTGDREVDRISAEGLAGLAYVLRVRTAVEAGEPVGIDPALDELAFFPLLYWPATPAQQPLSSRTVARINDYLRHGGLILFDMRDRSPLRRSGGAGRGDDFRRLLKDLNIPPLRPVPDNHALTRAFYLIDRFPGRWTGSDIWVERREGDVNDGVSSIVIGSNDYAAAWALDGDGFPLYPVVPGTDRQREWAMRFGVNLVMYALTGNYKADQVHIPAILRRLERTDVVPVE